jgi:hypothetical protein
MLDTKNGFPLAMDSPAVVRTINKIRYPAVDRTEPPMGNGCSPKFLQTGICSTVVK